MKLIYFYVKKIRANIKIIKTIGIKAHYKLISTKKVEDFSPTTIWLRF